MDDIRPMSFAVFVAPFSEFFKWHAENEFSEKLESTI